MKKALGRRIKNKDEKKVDDVNIELKQRNDKNRSMWPKDLLLVEI